MELEEFLEHFARLAGAFDRNVDSKTVLQAEYYKAFQYLTEPQWKRLVEKYIQDGEMFPKIVDLRRLAGEIRLYQADDHGPVEEPWVTIRCLCGYTMAAAKSDLRIPRVTYACPQCGHILKGSTIASRSINDHYDPEV